MTRFIATCILLLLFAFTGSAFAAQAFDPSSADPALLDTLRSVIDAAVHGQPLLAGALAVVLLCGVARRYMPAKWKEGIKGDIVGTALVFLMSFAGALATVFAVPEAKWSAAVMLGAAKVGWIAIGGYTVIHVIAKWIEQTKWYQEHAPDWLKTVLSLATGIFGSDALKKAKEAGDAAVAAEPPKGMKGNDAIEEVE
jgi:hypothetical protein